MNIVSLEPFITDILLSLGLEEQIVGVSHLCLQQDIIQKKTIVTVAKDIENDLKEQEAINYQLATSLSLNLPLLHEIKACNPDLILTKSPATKEVFSRLDQLENEARQSLGIEPKIYSFSPNTLNTVYQTFINIAKVCSHASKGKELSDKFKAQLENWIDNFYDRIHNKKVSVLFNLDPYILAGYWVPDIIKLASCHSHHLSDGKGEIEVSLEELSSFNSDAILIAPQYLDDIKAIVHKVLELNNNDQWSKISAVKRGNVAVANVPGCLYYPSYKLLSDASILLSLLAGFDSGYIAPKDSFYKLRWLELQRHRFV